MRRLPLPALLLLLLFLMVAPSRLALGCCNRGNPSSAAGRKGGLLRPPGVSRSPVFACRSLNEDASEGSLDVEAQLRLQQRAEGMLRLHAEGLRLMREQCEARHGLQPRSSNEGEAEARRTFERRDESGSGGDRMHLRSEPRDRRESSAGWRRLLNEYRQHLSSLDARLRRVEREGREVRTRRAAAAVFESDWEQDWEGDRDRDHDLVRSRDSCRYSRATSQEEERMGETGEIREILRLAQNHGLESLSYEQLVLLNEAVTMAATHSSSHREGDGEAEGGEEGGEEGGKEDGGSAVSTPLRPGDGEAGGNENEAAAKAQASDRDVLRSASTYRENADTGQPHAAKEETVRAVQREELGEKSTGYDSPVDLLTHAIGHDTHWQDPECRVSLEPDDGAQRCPLASGILQHTQREALQPPLPVTANGASLSVHSSASKEKSLQKNFEDEDMRHSTV